MRTRTRPRPVKLTPTQKRERERQQEGLRQELERLLVKHGSEPQMRSPWQRLRGYFERRRKDG